MKLGFFVVEGFWGFRDTVKFMYLLLWWEDGVGDVMAMASFAAIDDMVQQVWEMYLSFDYRRLCQM